MSTANSTLENLITTTIQQHPHLKRRKLHFENQSGRVVLRGIVSSYYQKQLAQEAVLRLAGVDQVENQLEVHWK